MFQFILKQGHGTIQEILEAMKPMHSKNYANSRGLHAGVVGTTNAMLRAGYLTSERVNGKVTFRIRATNTAQDPVHDRDIHTPTPTAQTVSTKPAAKASKSWKFTTNPALRADVLDYIKGHPGTTYSAINKALTQKHLSHYGTPTRVHRGVSGVLIQLRKTNQIDIIKDAQGRILYRRSPNQAAA